MFQDAPFSIVMGNAIPELKAMADYVTTDSDDDGILKALEHFGRI
ncbi:MAG: HAD hydrolase family protein [Erysipelotrichaceae bacterium]|nr:HAD hydrolase family protein [Erysipelotrichaceae bacterium]MCI9525072.1 HAD hydrolase family protein [Erysipelotrichaceae bacterium]